jgi:hypothetical protein
MNNMSEGKHTWKFAHRFDQKLTDKELKRYQKKLEEIRDRYEQDETFRMSNSYFNSPEKLDDQAISGENVFARFGNFYCDQHNASHNWHLLWNPNLSEDPYWSVLDNDCIEDSFKQKSKLIQSEIVHDFPQYFNLVDGGGDPVRVNIAENKSEKNAAKVDEKDEFYYDDHRSFFDDVIYDL